ncbi:MAG: hypothetical protein KatS3mg028_0850 [Bacteroidia bacterium]|nr:MAG: hypothetical protein KatS3mg028_0850 [Bacteroidia bacterium]
MKKKNSVIAISVLLLGCTAYKLAEPTEADVERAKSKFNDISLQQLKDGKKLYETNCNLCHKLFKPSKCTQSKKNGKTSFRQW